MNEKLKPCPFCGNKANIIKRSNEMWNIGCFEDPLCFGWSCFDIECDCGDGFVNKKKAIEYWNRRIE